MEEEDVDNFKKNAAKTWLEVKVGGIVNNLFKTCFGEWKSSGLFFAASI